MTVRAAQRRRAIVHYAVAVGIATIMMTWRLGLTPLDGHEAFVAVTARTMADRDHWLNRQTADGPVPPNTTLNHWLVPVFNGQPRLVKTPLAYWSLAVLIKLGLPLNEFTSRLPSALAAIALVALALALGRKLFSQTAALIGAVMLATSLGMFNWGRNARADIQMVFWMTAALTCFYLATGAAGRRRNAWLLAGWVAVGIASLAKQFVPLFVVLPAVSYLCWRASDRAWPGGDRPRRAMATYMISSAVGLVASVLVTRIPALYWWSAFGWSETLGAGLTLAVALGAPLVWYFFRCRGWSELKPLLPTALPGAAIACLLFVPWMWYMVHLFPQGASVLAHQTVERAVGSGGWLARSAAPLTGYYIQALGKWTLPWVVFLPGAMAIPFMRRFGAHRGSLVFLLLWVFGMVLLFSSAVGKHAQYILPALPAVCLLMGYCAEDVFFRHRWLPAGAGRAIVVSYAALATIALSAAIIAVVFAPESWRPRAVQLSIAAGIVGVVLWSGVVAFRRNRMRAVVASCVAAAALGSLAFASRADMWQRKPYLAALGRQAAATVPAGDRAAMWSKVDPSVIYYFGRDILPVFAERKRLHLLGDTPSRRRAWRQWLDRSGPLPWMFGRRSDIPALAELGYRPTDEQIAPSLPDKAPMLFRYGPAVTRPSSRPSATHR